MRTPPGRELSRREREIMNALFALEEPRRPPRTSGRRLTNPPSYSAVRAMLVRLEKKGYLRHQEDGRALPLLGDDDARRRRAGRAQAIRPRFLRNPSAK